MPQDFYSKLESLLKKDNRFVDQEGDLLKSACIDAAYKADKKLIELLLSDSELKNKFFSKVKEALVFKINDFIGYVQDKNFLADSYTKYRNKIGLNIDGKFLNERKEVALDWQGRFHRRQPERAQPRTRAAETLINTTNKVIHFYVRKIFGILWVY